MNEAANLFSFLTSVERTDVGRKRKGNEDSLIRVPSCGVFCVADGMGGEDSGEVASQATVEAVETAMTKSLPPEECASARKKVERITGSLRRASGWIQKRAADRGRGLCGSTVVLLVFDATAPGRAIGLHAGDSRIYRFRKGELEQITRDHSLAEEAGVKSRKQLPKMFRGMVTRGVGIREDLNLEETPVAVEPSDLFLLCSDGLTGMLPDKRIQKTLRRLESAPLDDVARTLVDEANEAGGDDNVSVILVRVGAFPAKPAGVPSGAAQDSAPVETPPRDTETTDTATRGPGGGEEGGTMETVRRPRKKTSGLARLFSGGLFGPPKS